jgi:hypothetical protein
MIETPVQNVEIINTFLHSDVLTAKKIIVKQILKIVVMEIMN